MRPYQAAGRSPPHPALRATFPPGGKVRRVREAAPYKAPLVKGGWHRRKAVTGGFRWPEPFPSSAPFGGTFPQGKAGRAHIVRPYQAAGRAPPHPALRATFPPGGKVRRVKDAAPFVVASSISFASA